MIKQNLTEIFNQIKNGNAFGEKVTLVGATKFVSVESINEAISLGLKDIAENRAQEFKDKYPLVSKPVNYHFIGSLQKNKVKYLIGKCHLIHSIDSFELLEEVNRQALNKGVIQNVLLEINVGEEEQKHGFSYEEIKGVLEKSTSLLGVKVKGFMAMLPESSDEKYLYDLAVKLRSFYDTFKGEYGFEHLSLGMSGDYLIAIKAGSNMIRVGSKIFGRRY